MQDLNELQVRERTLVSEILSLSPALRRDRHDLQEREHELEAQLEHRRRDLLKLYKRLTEKKTVHSHVHRQCPHIISRERRLEL
jgi:chromosome segregation ATPase